MRFHLFGRFLDYKEHTSKLKGSKYKVKYYILRVRDTEGKKSTWAIFDYSNKRNIEQMEEYQDFTLSLCGFTNRTPDGIFHVLEKWAVWDDKESRPRNPTTGRWGYKTISRKPHGHYE